MSFLKEYLSTIKNNEIKSVVSNVTKELFVKKLKSFDYKSIVNGLMIGEVQSGKTGQMFGVIAAASDEDFRVFLILTTDNSRLQTQTFKRALDSLAKNFCVCNEHDTIRFRMNKMRQPIVIVLKKNASVLKKWRNELLNSKFLEGNALFILDDEADAASLNTKVNKKDISSINKYINAIRKTASSCIYLQVTATPQAVLLQTKESGFKPEFIIYFAPGKHYLGGDFFFSSPEPYCIIETSEEEKVSITNPAAEDDLWLKKAILSFLVVCAHFKLSKYSKVCNFIIHPSIKTKDHEVVAEKVGETLNDILQGITDSDDEIKKNMQLEWNDLYSTKPEIKKFNLIYDCIKDMLLSSEIHIYTMNSKSEIDIDVETGFNIVVGGNILGRGVTFPNLQTIYYSRTAKTPQADTYWQHCRMFGYDRDRGLIRLFLPFSIFKLFQELNESQKVLITQITKYGIENTHLLYLSKIKPTRSNVVSSKHLSSITGGVNYFAAYPKNDTLEELDNILLPFNNKGIIECDVDLITKILSHMTSEDVENDWDSVGYINAVRMLADKQDIKKAKLIVSTDRKIGRNTGTMLSPTDRKQVDALVKDISLIMYRLTGDKELGWNGMPLWMPNIKLPHGFVFYKMDQ
jgi:hypothetical protein